MNVKIKSEYEKIRETICIMLLAIWMFIPILKEIKPVAQLITTYEVTYIQFVGIWGVFFLVLEVLKKSKNVKDKKEYDKTMLPIILLTIFMIWTLVSSIFAPNINNAFFGEVYRQEGYITYLGYAGFFCCAFFIKSQKNRKLIINMFVAAAVLNIVIVKFYYWNICRSLIVPRSLSRTCFLNSNHYGYYLLMATIGSIFLLITQKNKLIKVLYLISSGFLMYYLVMNNTFGCYLAMAITLLFFIIYYICKKKINLNIIFSVVIIVIVMIVNPTFKTIIKRNVDSLIKDIKNVATIGKLEKAEGDNKEEIKELTQQTGTTARRIFLWKNGIKFFFERPILGYGPDNLQAKYDEAKMHQDRPHNLLIHLALTSGVIGLVSYTSAVGIIVIRGLKKSKADNSIHLVLLAVIIAYLISSMFGNSMYYTSPYFFIFLGFLMRENIDIINIKQEERENLKK